MLEAEWLASEDPAAMLNHLTHHHVVEHPSGEATGGGKRTTPLTSDRKLQMFVEACRKTFKQSDWNVEPTSWERAARWWVSHVSVGDRPQKANLLRDIVGNPFRPVTLPVESSLPPNLKKLIQKPSMRNLGATCPWLTPTVLAIAQQAYEERARRVCDVCENRGRTVQGWTTAPDTRGLWSKCKTCNGVGRIADGSLDPVTLSILADALEDAGCDNEEILRHLRGEGRCPDHKTTLMYCGECQQVKEQATLGRGGYCCGRKAVAARCPTCKSDGWRPLRGPHVRGCWVLDLILGKE